jgi:tripartite-type tricarboxylate transporter receptor subunit TctC
MRGANRGIIAGVSFLLAGGYTAELNAQNYPNKLIRVIVPRAGDRKSQPS